MSCSSVSVKQFFTVHPLRDDGPQPALFKHFNMNICLPCMQFQHTHSMNDTFGTREYCTTYCIWYLHLFRCFYNVHEMKKKLMISLKYLFTFILHIFIVYELASGSESI